MIIFEWEKSVIETARSWPTSGPVYEFFNFWSNYHESGWVVLIIIIFCVYKFGWKKLIMPIIGSSAAVLLGDLISRRIVKVLVFRPRPNFIENICNTGKCLGFVSGHATNVSENFRIVDPVPISICQVKKGEVYYFNIRFQDVRTDYDGGSAANRAVDSCPAGSYCGGILQSE